MLKPGNYRKMYWLSAAGALAMKCATGGIREGSKGHFLCPYVTRCGKLCGLEDGETCPHQRKEED